MGYVFRGASSFNQPLEDWNTSSVTTMSSMFESAEAFNQPLSFWDVSSVMDMSYLFYGASAFNQSLCAWEAKLPNTVDMMDAFTNTACPHTTTPSFSSLTSGPFCHACD
jgi:surface protein